MRFIIKQHAHQNLINRVFDVKHEDVNENGDTIYCLDCKHPEDENAFLWVNELDGREVNMDDFSGTLKPESYEEFDACIKVNFKEIEKTENNCEYFSVFIDTQNDDKEYILINHTMVYLNNLNLIN